MHAFAVINFISAITLSALAGIAWQRQDRSTSRSFFLLMVALAVYSTGLGLESLSRSLETAWVWSRLQYIAIPFIPSLILLVVLRFIEVRLERPLMRTALISCFAFSLLIVGAHWSSPYHDLYYQAMHLGTYNDVSFMAFEPGPLYIAFYLYYVGISTLCIILLLRQVLVMEGYFRAQAAMILLGVLIPMGFNLLSVAGLSPPGLDIIPAAFSLGGIPLAYGLLNRGLLDIRPIAMQTVFSAIPSGCIIVDNERRLLESNQAAHHMLPQLQSLKPGDSIEQLYDSLPHLDGVLQQLSEPDQWELWSPDESSHYRVQLTKLRRHSVGMGYLIIMQDVTQQVQIENALRARAERDGLTGIMNRRSFDEQLSAMLHEAGWGSKALTLILFDIDHFKKLNDTQGHQAGDAVLQSIADVVPRCLRQVDILARYGGEEFAVLLPGTPVDSACEVAERIRTAVALELGVTVSLGVATAAQGTTPNPELLVRRADLALYAAKRAGRNRVERWVPELTEQRERH